MLLDTRADIVADPLDRCAIPYQALVFLYKLEFRILCNVG